MERMLRKNESHMDGETCKNKRNVKYESPKRRMSRSILDRARLYRSPTKKFDSSSFSKSRRGARCCNIENSECSLCKVSVQKINTLMTMIVGLHNVLVTKIPESKDRLNGSNNLIHQLRRRLVKIDTINLHADNSVENTQHESVE
ncbi:hypothetical protein CsatB_001530 [Cannabis sativa]